MMKKPTTYLRLPPDVRQLLRLAAAAADSTMSDLVSNLIRADAERTGITQLVKTGQQGGDR